MTILKENNLSEFQVSILVFMRVKQYMVVEVTYFQSEDVFFVLIVLRWIYC